MVPKLTESGDESLFRRWPRASHEQSRIQSRHHQAPPSTTGGNQNAITITGTAYVEETYIHVRWEWLILPLIETLLTAGLLLTAIIVDRRSGYLLLKASSLGLFFHGIGEWVPGDLKGRIYGVETGERLEEVAKEIVITENGVC